MFWDVILFIVLWLVGNFVGAYGFISPLICFQVGLPLANMIQRDLHVDTGLIKKKYCFSIIFLIIVDAILISLAIAFLHTLPLCGFFVGILLSLILGVKKTGYNQANLQDFLQTNIKLINPDHQHVVKNYITAKFDCLQN